MTVANYVYEQLPLNTPSPHPSPHRGEGNKLLPRLVSCSLRGVVNAEPFNTADEKITFVLNPL